MSTLKARLAVTKGQLFGRSGGVSKDDVEWCYRTILRRVPESIEVVEEHQEKSDLRQLVADFLQSPEYAKVAATRGLEIELPAATYIALGVQCFSSSFLRRLGVRHWSGPFDWTFSSLPMIAHCIADDFATFLDRDQYEPVPVEQRPNGPTVNRVQHRFYLSQFGVQFVFNHHDVHLDAGYAYIRRCVDRFRHALVSPGLKVFLVTCRQSPDVVTNLQQLAARISERTQHFRLVAFVIDSGPSPPLPAIVQLMCEPNLVVYGYSSVSPWGAVSFEDALDEACVARIFAKEAVTAFNGAL